MISYDEFEKVDIRVGKILEADDFPQAKKAAYRLKIDFDADIGIKNSSAQITKHYKKHELVGKLVLAVLNFEPKQIGPYVSEVLTLGVPDKDGEVVLVKPDKTMPIGGKLF